MGKHKTRKVSKTNPNSNQIINKEKKIRKKLKIIIILILIFTTTIGIIMIIKSLHGDFNEISTHRIPISKEYKVGFTTYNKPGIGVATEGWTMGTAELNGNIFLDTTLLSVGNLVDVRVQLIPRFIDGMHESTIVNETTITSTYAFYNNPKDVPIENIGSAFSLNSFVVFLGAENLENKNLLDDNIAIINLTNSVDPPAISGAGTIIFNLSGEREILVLDPSELSEYGKKIESFSKNYPAFSYFVLDEKLLPPKTLNATLAIVKHETFSEITGEHSEYSIEVKSPDDLAELKRGNVALAVPWVTLVVVPLTVLLTIYEKLAKHFTSKIG